MLSVYIETGTESYLSSTSAFGGVPCSHHLGGASRLCGNTKMVDVTYMETDYL